MLISIITINYNNFEGLVKTIGSVVCQTYNDIEYIVIDGGSTDGSVEVIRKNESQIDYWVSEKDKGVYHAMNKGISYANGKYIMFLNSGDYLIDENAIQCCLRNVKENQEVDIFYGDLLVVDNNNIQDVWERRFPDKMTLNFFKQTTLNHQASLIGTHLFKQLGLYPESFNLAADYWFLLKSLINNKKYKHLAFPIVVYDNSGISAANMDKYISQMKEIWDELVPACVNDVLLENESYKQIVNFELVKIAIKVNKSFQKLKNWE